MDQRGRSERAARPALGASDATTFRVFGPFEPRDAVGEIVGQKSGLSRKLPDAGDRFAAPFRLPGLSKASPAASEGWTSLSCHTGRRAVGHLGGTHLLDMG